jgi:hypothetical protein
MGLFDSYFDPEQFDASGGLLGRLISLQQRTPYAQDPRISVAGESASAVPWPTMLNDGRVPTSLPAARPYSSIPNFNQDGSVQNVAITSDQSVYCKTMKNLCHSGCVHLALRPDGFGPYRACMRACMRNAGCFDF